MDDRYLKGFREGFLAGLDTKENHKVSLFGLEVGELLDVVEEYVKKKKDAVKVLYKTDNLFNLFGAIRVEQWPEGIVLWAYGEIQWKSWERNK